MATIDTDYLVVGAGAAGMAFTDSLITESPAEVVMVDRRNGPGGHWNNAYPFVRLHQPSAYYGVNSLPLGANSIDETGLNAGAYERATAGEILDYFQRVLEQRLLTSGQVRFFGMCDYLGQQGGGHTFRSRLTGATTAVHVRRKVVDGRYLEAPVPSTRTPSFSVDADARFMPVNDLVDLDEPPGGFTVIGAGKTAMDACVWLLDNGVDPSGVRWVRPRDPWILDRRWTQGLDRIASFMEAVALNLEAAARAVSVPDLFRRLEACGQLLRLDRSIEPSMYRCAIVNQLELEVLRRIENVVRRGRVLPHRDPSDSSGGGISLDRSRDRAYRLHRSRSSVWTRPSDLRAGSGHVATDPFLPAHLQCRPDRLRGVGPRRRPGEERVCPANPYPDAATDWLATNSISWQAQAEWGNEPDLGAWMEHSRLNAARGIGEHLSDPGTESALARFAEHLVPALENTRSLMARPA